MSDTEREEFGAVADVAAVIAAVTPLVKLYVDSRPAKGPGEKK